MGVISQKAQSTKGFTIIELLVVIVVIGILASLTIFGYGNWRASTNDSERKNDIQQVATALSAYAIQKNTYVATGSACGVGGNGNGWLSVTSTEVAGYSAKSILGCLQDAKVLKTSDYIDPTGCIRDSGGKCGTASSVPVPAYMKATCTKSSIPITYVFGYLETQPSKIAEVDALCDAGSVAGFTSTSQKWGTLYGMNHYVVAK